MQVERFMSGFGSRLRGRKPSRRLVVGISIAIVLALAVGGWRLSRAPADAATAAATKDKDTATPPLVTVVIPSLGNVASTVSLTGLISATNDMPIGVEGDPAITSSAGRCWRD